MGNNEVKDSELNDRDLVTEKRERRKKRRIRNQIMAYVTLVLVIAMVASGGFLTWNYFGTAPEKPQEEEPNSVMQSQVDELLQNEPEISMPEPTVEPEPEPTPEEKLNEIVDAAISVMPLEDKVAGLFIVTPEAITGVGTEVKEGEGTKTAMEANQVG